MNQTIMFVGKGGVGKTTSAVSAATYIANVLQKPVALIDYDGGHSIKTTLGFNQATKSNTLIRVQKDLYIASIDPIEYSSISTFDKRNGRFNEYVRQFTEDWGLIPLYDMPFEFWGLLPDLDTVQKFIGLTIVIQEVIRLEIPYVVIDVEPTAGLKRLLTGSEALIRSMNNLKQNSELFLKMISVKWPDVAGFLRSRYVKNIDQYTSRLLDTISMLKKAYYCLVCVPEQSPVQQSFIVRDIVRSYGGTVVGYVINNVVFQVHEKKCISLVKEQKLPVVEIERTSILHQSETVPIDTYISMGEKIFSLIY